MFRRRQHYLYGKQNCVLCVSKMTNFVSSGRLNFSSVSEACDVLFYRRCQVEHAAYQRESGSDAVHLVSHGNAASPGTVGHHLWRGCDVCSGYSDERWAGTYNQRVNVDVESAAKMSGWTSDTSVEVYHVASGRDAARLRDGGTSSSAEFSHVPVTHPAVSYTHLTLPTILRV